MRPDYCPVVKEPCQEPRCMINGCELRQYQNRAHKREWQGLTEDEVSAAVDDCDVYFDDEFLVDFARRIEAKLKEKNNG